MRKLSCKYDGPSIYYMILTAPSIQSKSDRPYLEKIRKDYLLAIKRYVLSSLFHDSLFSRIINSAKHAQTVLASAFNASSDLLSLVEGYETER